MTIDEVLGWLNSQGSAKRVDEMLSRFGIPNDRAFGVSMGELNNFAKRIGKDHLLAAELWKTGWYEARTIAVFANGTTN